MADIPTNDDMREVIDCSREVARLENALDDARVRLRIAWARVPVDTNILRKPWRSDIGATCIECGASTRWRTGRGLAKCQPACAVKHRAKISDELWSILDGKLDENASLDDDE